MNKLQAKQIYLLMVAVFGIIAVSIYSTYAIFTIESKSDNIVSIHTPENLQVSSNTYEYKQVTVPKNSYITTDVDIYNNFDYELCYSIWYKVVNNDLTDNIKIYENTSESLTTSSTIGSVTSRRISLLIINDNDIDIKINIGVVYAQNEGTCQLNISEDKSLISWTIDAKDLANTLIKETEVTNSEAGYLTYKDLTKDFALSSDKTYYISRDFTYEAELFTLKEAELLDIEKLKDYENYYLCEKDNHCQTLYYINEINNENHKITKYNMLIGYLAGDNGLRRINNDYYYSGDNPHNFIYYNCTNELDTKTCELWRIIGFYYNEMENQYITKIIRNDYLNTHIFDENNNVWNNSSISKYLNDEYKLNNESLVQEFTFKEQNILSLDTNINEIALLEKENKAKVSLLNLSDYLYTSACTKDKISEYDELCFKNNWLNRNVSEWTMSTKFENSYIDEKTKEEIIPENNTVYSVGNNLEETNINDELNIRPVIYLRQRALLTSGDGTLDNPYIIR